MLRCPVCGALHAHLQMAGLPVPSCCAETVGSAVTLEEDVTGRIFVQVRPSLLLPSVKQAYLMFRELEAVLQHGYLLVTGLLQPGCCAGSAGAL